MGNWDEYEKLWDKCNGRVESKICRQESGRMRVIVWKVGMMGEGVLKDTECNHYFYESEPFEEQRALISK